MDLATQNNNYKIVELLQMPYEAKRLQAPSHDIAGEPDQVTDSELKAAMRHGKQKANRAKITLVGPGRAGKTCVARSFINMPFENTLSTQGIDDLKLWSVIAKAGEGKWSKKKEFEKLFEGHLASMVVEHHNSEKITISAGGTYFGSKEPSVVVGAIPRLPNMPVIPSTDHYATADSPGRLAFENSSDPPLHQDNQNVSGNVPTIDGEYVQKTIGEIRREGLGLVVSIHDFGGQRVFDVIHSFFLGPNGVYVLVFDMARMRYHDSWDSRLQEIMVWANTIILHTSIPDNLSKQHKCASIAIVGTHKDVVWDKEFHTYISKTLETLLIRSIARRSLLENESEGLCFFPVDCTKGQADPTMVNLMKALETDILKSDYVNIERPLTFFKVLDEMNESKKTVSYLSLKEVSEIAYKYEVGSQDLIEDMLRFFRELGLIMWHEEPSLRSFVILDPIKFFVSPATNIVCQHVKDEQGTIHSNETLRKAQIKYRDDFDVMKSTGVVSSNLLRFILEEHIKGENQTGQQLNVRYEVIKKLMNKYDLIVPMFDDFGLDELDVNTPKKYLVPSLLESLNEREDLNPRKNTLFMWCSRVVIRKIIFNFVVPGDNLFPQQNWKYSTLL